MRVCEPIFPQNRAACLAPASATAMARQWPAHEGAMNGSAATNGDAWDWTSKYDRWSMWQADLENADSAEKARLQAQRKRDKMQGLQHVSCCSDHSEELRIYEKSPSEQLADCDGFKFEGMLFYNEGQYYRAAGKFRMILVYLAYSFPEVSADVARFRDLEVLACLSLAQCKLKTRQFVEAAKHATAALDKALDGDDGGATATTGGEAGSADRNVDDNDDGGQSDAEDQPPSLQQQQQLQQAPQQGAHGAPDLRSAVLALHRRAQSAAHRGLYAEARGDLRAMGGLLHRLAPAASAKSGSGRSGSVGDRRFGDAADGGRGGDVAVDRQVAFCRRFAAKLRKQATVVEDMERSHALRARSLSKRMFRATADGGAGRRGGLGAGSGPAPGRTVAGPARSRTGLTEEQALLQYIEEFAAAAAAVTGPSDGDVPPVAATAAPAPAGPDPLFF